MSIPYRTRRFLRRFFSAVLGCTVLVLLALLGWLLWLNRFVIYTPEGAKLDFSISATYAPGETPVPPEAGESITVHNVQIEAEETVVSTELTQFSGYYVTVDALTGDFDTVQQQLMALPDGSTVMLQLKDLRGYVYYTSEAGKQNPNFNVAKTDSLLKQLLEKNCYVIVQIPAFQDYYFIMDDEMERVAYGLPKAGGTGSLWLDKNGPCYWLNPVSDGTLTYLIGLVTELRSMGIDEVVFSDFRFPDTDAIKFEGDRLEALNDCAATLVKSCATKTFCVSFTRSAADLTLPAGRTRLYFANVSAADAAVLAAASGLEDTAAQVVFLTELNDTRFDDYSVLRPLSSAH